jgi:hypothetical protein
MKSIYQKLFLATLISLRVLIPAHGQDEGGGLHISGSWLTDERVLVRDGDWAWNENRLTLLLDHTSGERIRFRSELWATNLGLPTTYRMSDLYNKGVVDPFRMEVREANLQFRGFLIKSLDLTVGRQRIAWGTGDQIGPLDNLNPADLEDILDFGRRRGVDALNLTWYPHRDFSAQFVFIPWFRPANMPVGIFADVLMPSFELMPGMTMKQFTDTLILPHASLSESASAGLRLKGFWKGIDLSLSYLNGHDQIPLSTYNLISLVDTAGGTAVHSTLSYPRFHIIGADVAVSIAGIGIRGEAALFVPTEKITMRNDLSPIFQAPIYIDSLLLDPDKPYLKGLIGADYYLPDGSYLNLQYLHGFLHEQGGENLADYFFLRYEKTFFRDRLKLVPLGGAFIINDWGDIGNNYALAYLPEISYKPHPNAELLLGAAIFHGKGDNLFVNLATKDMLMFKVKYNF